MQIVFEEGSYSQERKAQFDRRKKRNCHINATRKKKHFEKEKDIGGKSGVLLYEKSTTHHAIIRGDNVTRRTLSLYDGEKKIIKRKKKLLCK